MGFVSVLSNLKQAMLRNKIICTSNIKYLYYYYNVRMVSYHC